MSTIEKAIEIAANAHAGKTDKAGAPYIFHPIRVMLAVSDPLEKMVAILHDVVEDTKITLEDLKSAGFPFVVLDAVESLTKTKGESRLAAAARALKNPIAKVVKLADVKDNMDLSRISNPSQEDFNRLEEYKQVLALLEP